ncbi:hypothetical protein [Jannaschia sp. LMIT008]|uniref:hypothetical protein n=1 Tax=Jannaschia maritima TaxID=3032585 RepID=UPI002811575F|nr:hypothetical protein [Jannaschia sp. LMIT008]
MRRPRLLAWLGGMPDVETLLPILQRVAERGALDVDAHLYGKLLRKEPRLAKATTHPALRLRLSSKLRMRFLWHRDATRADGIVSIADPVLDRSPTRRRSNALSRGGHAVAFVQHGVLQTAVNHLPDMPPPAFAAERLLLWDRPGPPLDPTDPRCVTIGFPKRPLLDPVTPPPALAAWRASHRTAILVCHSFRWPGKRFADDAVPAFFTMLEEVARAAPEIGLILRGHRVKREAVSDALEVALVQRYPNVLRCGTGAAAILTGPIDDAIAVCDAVVGPISTVLLDAAYRNRPTAAFDDDPTALQGVGRIRDAADLTAFARDPSDDGSEALRRRFGDMDGNLDRAAGALEDWLGA